jgi:hypothetical protein
MRLRRWQLIAIDAIDKWQSISGFLKPEFSSKAMAYLTGREPA